MDLNKLAKTLTRYKDAGCDNVTYSQTNKKGMTEDKVKAACYASLLNHGTSAGSWGIECRPRVGDNYIPTFAYRRFFHLLKRYGIVPEEVKISQRQGQHILTIPQLDWDYHSVYVTLCMYRHTEQHGQSIAGRSLGAYNLLRRKGVHFLQCLHWAFMNTTYSTGHSFINLTNSTSLYGGTNPKYRSDLRYGLALALYGKIPLEERAKAANPSLNFFVKLAERMEKLPIKDANEVLDPAYAGLYENPESALIKAEGSSK